MPQFFPRSHRFWDLSDAWFRAKKEEIEERRRQGTLRASNNIETKARYALAWIQRNKAKQTDYGRIARLSDSRRVDPRLQSSLLRLAQAAAPATAEIMDQELANVALRAFRLWPVRTGFSKALIHLEYSVTQSGALRGTVGNRAPYVFFIAGHPHRQVDRLFRAAIQRIGPRIRDRIAQRGR